MTDRTLLEAALRLGKSTMTGVIRRLEKAELITRQPGERDRLAALLGSVLATVDLTDAVDASAGTTDPAGTPARRA